jgi:8-oxo-dGTP pyrophosphatase MutT (NUDIX family)
MIRFLFQIFLVKLTLISISNSRSISIADLDSYILPSSFISENAIATLGLPSVEELLSSAALKLSLPILPKPLANVIPSGATTTGAGILPISVDPVTQQAVVLLANEPRHGNATLRGFSDFGGSKDSGETDAQTAVREFMEEIGLSYFEYVAGRALDTSTLTRQSIFDAAETSKHATSKPIPLYYTPHGYVSYILPLPYKSISTITAELTHVRTTLGGKATNSKDYPYFEKQSFAWIPLSEIIAYLTAHPTGGIYTVPGQPGPNNNISWRFLGGQSSFGTSTKRTEILNYLSTIKAP